MTDWLCITILHMNFSGFSKNSNFRSKYIGDSLWFYRKWAVWGKNWPKLSISWSLSSYYGLIIHNSLVYEFLQVLKKLKFSLKIRRDAYGYTKNHQFGAKIDRNSVFLGRNPYIADRLCITVSYMSFYRFWKIPNFHSKSKVLVYCFSENR
jgi:hypothetical protein